MTDDLRYPDDLVIDVGWPELILRFDESSDGKNLTGYIVPWDIPAPVVRPVRGLEIWRAGALTRTLNRSKEIGRPIPLFAHHESRSAVATLVDTHSDKIGQFAHFRALDTTIARDSLEEYRAGLLPHFSVGGIAIPKATKLSRNAKGETIIERSEAMLDHVGLVRSGAYGDSARVLALRHAEGEGDEGADEVEQRNREAVVRARARMRARSLER